MKSSRGTTRVKSLCGANLMEVVTSAKCCCTANCAILRIAMCGVCPGNANKSRGNESGRCPIPSLPEDFSAWQIFHRDNVWAVNEICILAMTNFLFIFLA